MVPLLRAWSSVGQGKTTSALQALKPLSKKKGAKSLHDLHAALINETAGNNTEAAKYFVRVMKAQAGGSLRITKLLGPFYERQGQSKKARALYDNYMKRNPNSRLFDIDYARIKQGKIPKSQIVSAIDGVAEGMFGIASSLRRQNAVETALIIGQIGLYLKPNFPIMRIMIGGILDSDERYENANAVYRKSILPHLSLGRRNSELRRISIAWTARKKPSKHSNDG